MAEAKNAQAVTNGAGAGADADEAAGTVAGTRANDEDEHECPICLEML